jgi:hypothetical protein
MAAKYECKVGQNYATVNHVKYAEKALEIFGLEAKIQKNGRN